MASVKIFPRMDKINLNGRVPIYLRITKNRSSKYIALDIYINPNDWNNKTGKIKPGAVNAAQINTFLSQKEAEAESISLEMESRSKFVTAYDIKAKITGKMHVDFFTFIDKRIKQRTEELSVGTIRHYKSVLTKLRNFCKKDQLYFDEINIELMRSFQQYLACDLHNHVNTIHGNLKIIRTIIHDAIAEELIPYERNPFLKIKLKAQKTSRSFLLDDELDKLEQVELVENSQISHHRNLYIFSAYTAGIRISDLLTMRWKNFDGEHLYFNIKKNQEDISIKLPEKSLTILNFYHKLAQGKHGNKPVDPESFIFPLLRITTDETDKLKIYKAISSATAYTNKDLLKIAADAKIKKHISFHSARHSWAVRALQKGMRIEYVSKLMGHASVKQTEAYAKILNEELDKAMDIFNTSSKLAI